MLYKITEKGKKYYQDNHPMMLSMHDFEDMFPEIERKTGDNMMIRFLRILTFEDHREHQFSGWVSSSVKSDAGLNFFGSREISRYLHTSESNAENDLEMMERRGLISMIDDEEFQSSLISTVENMDDKVIKRVSYLYIKMVFDLASDQEIDQLYNFCKTKVINIVKTYQEDEDNNISDQIRGFAFLFLREKDKRLACDLFMTTLHDRLQHSLFVGMASLFLGSENMDSNDYKSLLSILDCLYNNTSLIKGLDKYNDDYTALVVEMEDQIPDLVADLLIEEEEQNRRKDRALSRNSEHKRKIIKTKGKKTQEIKKHTIRKRIIL